MFHFLILCLCLGWSKGLQSQGEEASLDLLQVRSSRTGLKQRTVSGGCTSGHSQIGRRRNGSGTVSAQAVRVVSRETAGGARTRCGWGQWKGCSQNGNRGNIEASCARQALQLCFAFSWEKPGVSISNHVLRCLRHVIKGLL